MTEFSGVWDLTEKRNGDHVLVALTPAECACAIEALQMTAEHGYSPSDRAMGERVKREIERSLHDQKGEYSEKERAREQ